MFTKPETKLSSSWSIKLSQRNVHFTLSCLVPPVALTVHTDVFHTYGPFLPHHRIRVVLGKYEAAVVFAGTSERKKVNEMFIKFVGGRNRTCDGS